MKNKHIQNKINLFRKLEQRSILDSQRVKDEKLKEWFEGKALAYSLCAIQLEYMLYDYGDEE